MRAIGRNARHGEYVPEWNGEPVINHIFESAGQVSDHAADYGENPSARHETDGRSKRHDLMDQRPRCLAEIARTLALIQKRRSNPFKGSRAPRLYKQGASGRVVGRELLVVESNGRNLTRARRRRRLQSVFLQSESGRSARLRTAARVYRTSTGDHVR
jgi:hypothetical protein